MGKLSFGHPLPAQETSCIFKAVHEPHQKAWEERLKMTGAHPKIPWGGQNLRAVKKHAGKPNFPRHCKYLCWLWLLQSKQNNSQASLCQDNPGNTSLSSLPWVYPREPCPKIPDKTSWQGAEWKPTLLLPVTRPPSTPANLQHYPQALYSQPPRKQALNFTKFYVSGAQWGHRLQFRDIFQDSIQSGLQNGNKSSIFCIKIINPLPIYLMC